MKKTFSIFSYLLHPLFIPIFGACLFFLFEHHYFTKIQITVVFIQFVIITILLPLTIFYLLLSLKKVDGLMVAQVNQRKLPLIFNIILLSIFVSKAIRAEYFTSLNGFLIGGILASFITLIGVYLKQKFSIHTLGLAALLVYAISLQMQYPTHYRFMVPIIIVLLGAVWSSRLFMNAHSNKELIFGALIGGLSQVVVCLRFV